MKDYIVTEAQQGHANGQLFDMELCLATRTWKVDIGTDTFTVAEQQREKDRIVKLIKLAKAFLREQHHVDENGEALQAASSLSAKNVKAEVPAVVVMVRNGVIDEIASTDPAMKGRQVLKVDRDDVAYEEFFCTREPIRIMGKQEMREYLKLEAKFQACGVERVPLAPMEHATTKTSRRKSKQLVCTR